MLIYINIKYSNNSCPDCLRLSGDYTISISRFAPTRSQVLFCVTACAFPLSFSPATIRQEYERYRTSLYKMQTAEQNGYPKILSYIYLKKIKTQTAVPEIENL